MNNSSKAPLKPALKYLVTAIAFSLHGTAFANAGKVMFAIGDVTILGKDGKSRAAKKGSTVYSGDLLQTGTGIAQIRFTDGAYVSIQKDSEFRIDEYHYEGKSDGNEKGLFSLIKGGFRTITGLIGRVNRENYQVKTPYATIGIRGTEYLAELGNSITITVADGAIEICNNAGCTFLREGELGYIKNLDSAIQKLKDQGIDVTTTTSEGETKYVITEDATTQGETTVIPEITGNVPDCSTYNCYFAFSRGDSGKGFNGLNMNHNGEFSGINLTSFGYACGTDIIGAGVGTATSQGVNSSNSNIAIGRWTGGTVTLTGMYPPYPFIRGTDVTDPNGFHYAIGTPTPNITSLSGSYQYSLSGHTNPTGTAMTSLGNLNSASGSLTANFDSYTVSNHLMLGFTNETYNLYGTAGISTMYAPGTFSGSLNVSAVSSSSFSGGGGSFTGFFAGNNASDVGLTYNVMDYGRGQLNGAVQFGNPTPVSTH